MAKILIDIVSDLHIDQWNTDLDNKYPCGQRSNYPYDFDNKKANILVVAGDTSDNINLSLDYLEQVSEKYDKILFIDGNHEHVHKYPNLYKTSEINEKVKARNSNKLVYLPENHYIIDKTVFIGFCGWWDYNNKTESDKSINYFKKWIPEFTENESRKFINNVTNQSINEAEKLKESIDKYNNDPNINNIIIVTHTVPHDSYCSLDKNNNHEISTELNTKIRDLIKSKNINKISHWIFGHTHAHYESQMNNIHFVCNPRGRPEDYNRNFYNLKTLNTNTNKSRL